ncbi:MAG: 4Fe-4S dicluster domain-containing protein [Thermoanaerobaculia bacterium]
MAYVITDACIKDGLCLDACPNESIRPLAADADYETVSQLYISPDECLDCGACESACTSNAIFAGDMVPGDKQYAIEANAAYFAK